MTFGIDYRDTPRVIRFKLLYLVPFIVAAIPILLVTHGVTGVWKFALDVPGEVRHIRWRLKGGRVA